MKKNSLILLFLLSVIAFAQNDNPIKNAMETMKNSKILYKFKELKTPIPKPDRDGLINALAYREKLSGKYVVKKMQPTGEAKKAFNKAESFFSSHKYAEARNAYTLALEQDPKLYSAITYIAQTYGIEKNWEKAELWYKKAIEANDIDYLSHWMLADIYLVKGQKEKALQEISIAKVLNRNNPRLEAKRKEIFAANGLETKDWTFNPQARVSKDSSGAVTIEADSIWTIYGAIQAAWTFEPEYKKRADTSSNMPEEMYREWLMGLIPFIDTHKDSLEVLRRLDRVLTAQKVGEFIAYEIILPNHPSIAFRLNAENIERIKDYLIWVNKK